MTTMIFKIEVVSMSKTNLIPVLQKAFLYTFGGSLACFSSKNECNVIR